MSNYGLYQDLDYKRIVWFLFSASNADIMGKIREKKTNSQKIGILLDGLKQKEIVVSRKGVVNVMYHYNLLNVV